VQSQPSVAAQHPQRLGEQPSLVCDVHGAVLHPDRIEAGIPKWHVGAAAKTEMHQPGQVHSLAQAGAGFHELSRKLQHRYLAAQLARQQPGSAPQATADV
jgi:hypothetical protein